MKCGIALFICRIYIRSVLSESFNHFFVTLISSTIRYVLHELNLHIKEYTFHPISIERMKKNVEKKSVFIENLTRKMRAKKFTKKFTRKFTKKCTRKFTKESGLLKWRCSFAIRNIHIGAFFNQNLDDFIVT